MNEFSFNKDGAFGYYPMKEVGFDPPYLIADECRTHLYYAAENLMNNLPQPQITNHGWQVPYLEIQRLKDAYNTSMVKSEDAALLEVLEPFLKMAEGESKWFAQQDPEVRALHKFFNGEMITELDA